jgi:DNA primase large subunit
MNKEIRVEILDYFKVEDKDVIYDSVHKQPFVKIHCIDYLELLEEGLSVQAPQFDLVNQTLYNGFVYLEYQRFIYLLRLSLEQRLYQKIKSMKVYKDNDLINECVSVLKGKYPEYDKQRAPSKGNIPESIKELIEIAYRDHHLGHRQRIKLGIYLQSNGFDMEFILDIFRQLSDWNEKVTRYQLNSLKRYINK